MYLFLGEKKRSPVFDGVFTTATKQMVRPGSVLWADTIRGGGVGVEGNLHKLSAPFHTMYFMYIFMILIEYVPPCHPLVVPMKHNFFL